MKYEPEPTESFFHRHNQKLLSQFREKLQREANADGIKEATGVEEQLLLSQLAELGVTRETIEVIHMVPLVQVAWADGEIQKEEAELLHKAAPQCGVKSESALLAFEALLKERPSELYFKTAQAFIRHLFMALPEEEAQIATQDLYSLAMQVAKASGGIFGFFSVDEQERAALKEIIEEISGVGGVAAEQLLKSL